MLAVTASNALRCKPGAYYETYIVVDEGRFYIQDSGAVEDRQMPYSSTDGDKGGYIMGIFGPKGNKKALGERSQAIIIFRLLEAGYNILTPMEITHAMIWLLRMLMRSSGASSVRQGGLRTMALISHLKPPVHTTIQKQEERAMGEETIEDRLSILWCTVLIQEKRTLCL